MRRKLKAGTVVLAVTALGVLANVSPAFAEGAGVTVEGSSTINGNLVGSKQFAPPELCAVTQPNSGIMITLFNVGTIGAVDSTNSDVAAVYAGPSTATFTTNRLAFNPVGTYQVPQTGNVDTNPCFSEVMGVPVPNVPQPITITNWNISTPPTPTSPTVTVSATCSGTTGTYIRVTNAYKIQVQGSCHVTTEVHTLAGSITRDVTENPTTFVFTGNENPCLDDFAVPATDIGPGTPAQPAPIPNCEPPLPTSPNLEFQGVYAQTPTNTTSP